MMVLWGCAKCPLKRGLHGGCVPINLTGGLHRGYNKTNCSRGPERELHTSPGGRDCKGLYVTPCGKAFTYNPMKKEAYMRVCTNPCGKGFGLGLHRNPSGGLQTPQKSTFANPC